MSSLRRSLHDAWWRLVTQPQPASFSDAAAAGLLGLASSGYQAVAAARNAAYDVGWRRPAVLPATVISIGNLTVGGTGKTACVQFVVEKLLRMGRRVAVLSRGYGGVKRRYWLQQRSGRLMMDGQPSAERLEEAADEPQLLATVLEGVPIVVGADRARAGRLACRQFGCDTLVMDDGFQHRRLHRDCDIVLVHARTPFGGWRLLPRGPMREPLGALRRAQAIIVTKADEALETLHALTERLQALNPNAMVATAVHQPCGLLETASNAWHDAGRLAGLRVGLVSSIGDPEGFESTLRRLQATVAWHRIFPDHHPYTAEDLAALADQARRAPVDAVVTTTKDWVRLQSAMTPPLWVLQVRMKLLSGESELDDRLARVCAR
ncbi:MAG: tetraacyldisaccharide 4'-kinase [Candidatus Omnitrophica bacterium]|nr:tetraacyldisaccharide 4'-kinase [Candidatus Omnitrophota bacterium]